MKVADKSKRTSTNLSIDGALVGEARQLGLNISRAAENGLAEAVQQAKIEKWKLANKNALESCNFYVETHGLPLAKYRTF